jgi:hypothetical protein
MVESSRPKPRAVIGLLSDMLARRLFPANLATISVPYKRILQILPIMDDSFLSLKAWQRILKRI